MSEIKQGDILQLEKPSIYILVLSKDFFNQSGFIIACPVAANTFPDALHIPVSTEKYSGKALLEHLRSLDIRSRLYRHISSLPFDQIQEISDAVQSIFEYYPLSL